MKNYGEIEKRFEEISRLVSDPNIIAENQKFAELMIEYKELEETVEKFREYKKIIEQNKQAESLLSDPELKELASVEFEETKIKKEQLEEELKEMLIPKDVDDHKNVIVEIRAGAGGEEAALFAGVLYRMYSMYAETKHWQIEILYENETGLGGYKEITFMITGKGAYSRLRYESGVHRVQRVPETESSGRIHTSTVTVAVLPEAEEVDIEINMDDIRVDTYRSSGAGGQHVNKTSSAVRLTHIPTNTVVECQSGRSQLQNRETAMTILRTRLYEQEQERLDKEYASKRRSQVGSGDRSEKIRTYNYPQGRITDHRINESIYKFDDFLNGNIDELIDLLAAYRRAELLASSEE